MRWCLAAVVLVACAHTFGTEMARQGIPLPVLQELMGHADVSTTRRYITIGEDQKRAAIAAVWQPRGSEPLRNEKSRASDSTCATSW